MRPDGPEPTIAIGGFVPVFHGSGKPAKRTSSLPGLTSFSRCGRNHSTCPIAIGTLWRHTPWHWSSCGHTRPVTSGSGFEPSINSNAWRNLPWPMSSSICGMWIRTGHPPFGGLCSATKIPSSHGFSAHCLSRSASSQTNNSTSRSVNPRFMYPR